MFGNWWGREDDEHIAHRKEHALSLFSTDTDYARVAVHGARGAGDARRGCKGLGGVTCFWCLAGEKLCEFFQKHSSLFGRIDFMEV
ncbi:MAG: hypothetical protein HDR57_03360 [Treponema sp.]|nr:hypothetical protein [Treponema sp.]